MMNRTLRYRGIVLLTTLLLLALAAVVLGGLVRTSLRRGAAARDAQQDLQRRWAIASIREALLPTAADLIDAAAPATQVQVQLTLGGQHFDVRLSDEQARVNVNMLYRELGLERARRELSRMLSTSALRSSTPPPALVLRPDRRAADDAAVPAFASWSQVFENPTASWLFGTDPQRPRTIDDLTCWGDGKLNVQRASPRAIQVVTQDILTAAQRTALVDARAADREPQADDPEPATAASILESVALSDQQREALEQRVTETSAYYGLLVRSDDGRRSRYEWQVAQVLPATTADAAAAAQRSGEMPKVSIVARMAW